MIWNNLSKSIAKEYEEFPNDFLNKPNSKAAYLGEGKNVWKKIKHHPYWAVDDLKDKHLFGQVDYNGYSHSTIRTVMYIKEMQKYFPAWNVRFLTDFGPGYGNSTRVWDVLFGQADSYYQLVDFEELQCISRDYLAKHEITANHRTYDTMLSPKDLGKSLFFASHSMNECSMEVRNSLEKSMADYDYIYITYNSHFDNIDNLEYFEKLAKRLPHKAWTYHEQSTAKWRLIGVL